MNPVSNNYTTTFDYIGTVITDYFSQYQEIVECSAYSLTDLSSITIAIAP